MGLVSVSSQTLGQSEASWAPVSGSTRWSPGITGMAQSPAAGHSLSMVTTLRSRLLLLVMAVVTQGARGQEQPPGTPADGALTCEEDRDCLSPGAMCCFDLTNLTLASASQVHESAIKSKVRL